MILKRIEIDNSKHWWFFNSMQCFQMATDSHEIVETKERQVNLDQKKYFICFSFSSFCQNEINKTGKQYFLVKK